MNRNGLSDALSPIQPSLREGNKGEQRLLLHHTVHHASLTEIHLALMNPLELLDSWVNFFLRWLYPTQEKGRITQLSFLFQIQYYPSLLGSHCMKAILILPCTEMAVGKTRSLSIVYTLSSGEYKHEWWPHIHIPSHSSSYEAGQHRIALQAKGTLCTSCGE